jgi:CRISPR system Cascade subunit CasA
VHEYINVRREGDWQFRLWSFGYDMENMKPCCWYEAKFPLIMVVQNNVFDYEEALGNLVKAASIICGNIKVAINRVLYGKPEFDSKTKKIKWKYHGIKKTPVDEEKEIDKVLFSVKEKSLFNSAEAYFWQTTESSFYEALRKLKGAIESGCDCVEIFKEYHQVLCREAEKQFSYHVLNGSFEDMDPKKIVFAEKELTTFNNSLKVKDLLRLP